MLYLFVIADTAAVVGDASDVGLLCNRLGRSGLREFIIHGADSSFRRILDYVEDPLSKRVVPDLYGADICSHQCWIRMRCEFAVGHVVAEHVEVAVVVVLVVFVIEGRKRSSLIGLERGNGT